MEKHKVVIEYSKLTPELLAVFDETFPTGVAGKTIRFPNSKGEIVSAVRIETEDSIYLVKIMARPKEVLSDEELDEMVRPSAREKDEELEGEDDSAEEEDEPQDKPEADSDEE
jgi:hypothetical protein